jgi:hypothetical protein
MSENFNYIAYGDWDRLLDENGTIEMSRGRMFEYTPTDIEKRLEDLSPDAITFLEQLPTFFCSEISSLTGSMLVKYGRTRDIRIENNEVFASFETLIDFGELSFSNVKYATTVFKADKFQLHRTHWAVRKGDVGDILNNLAQILPAFRAQVDQQLHPVRPMASTEPPPRKKNIVGNASSVEEFLALLYELSKDTSKESFFRGHEDARFELIPSLLRRQDDGAWKYMPKEDRLCKELLIAHYDEFQGDLYCFDRLVRMQHYGLPTRLLDISGNPLVALFFACAHADEATDISGEVIIFKVDLGKVKYYDSDTVSCLANLSNLTYEQKSIIDLNLEINDFNQSEAANKLLHHVKSEKGYFEARIRPEDIGSIVCVKAKQTNMRIKSQSGAFLLFGHEATLSEAGQEGIEIARVTITNKLNILRQLDSININATTVYPSIDQTAVHLRDRYLHKAT